MIFDLRLHGGSAWGPLEVVSPSAGTLSLPTRVNKGVPSYPDTARRSGTEATIVVGTNTDASGKVVSARVIDGASFFDDLVQAAAERWTFTPTMLDGVAVPTTVTTTIRFVLRK